jgi:hypothetical protein
MGLFFCEMNKIQRSRLELVQAFADQLHILKTAILHVKNGDDAFTKTIAGVLRILVHEAKTNKPLLINIAKEYNIVPYITTSGHKGVLQRNLNQYLDDVVYYSDTAKITLTKRQIIAKISQQEGGAHEDWAIEKDLLHARGDGILIGGRLPLVRVILGIGECILECGNEVLASVNNKIDEEVL